MRSEAKMASCKLWIEIDRPDDVYAPSDVVRGTVHVLTEKEVSCKSLDIEAVWKTHGKGNIDAGSGEKQSLFQGRWEEGELYSYPFEISPAPGPSTYHGHYLNVDHYVTARVDVPWAFDPKTETAFQVQGQLPADEFAAATGSTTPTIGCAGWFLATVFAVILVGFLATGALPWLAAGGIAFLFALWWLFGKYLPQRAIGKAEWQLDRGRFAPGDEVSGVLTVNPPKDLPIEQLTWTIKAAEECISGSGSNQTTHTHVLYETTTAAAPAGVIRGGHETRYKFSATLPETPIYSLSLGDNELKWSGELRVHIPRWPDWVQRTEFQVAPVGELPTGDALTSPQASVETGLARSIFLSESEPEPDVEPPTDAQPTITFAESARMIWQVRNQEDQLERVLDAVRKTPLDFAARIEGRDLFAGRDKYAYPGGDSYRADLLDPPTPLVIYIKHELDDAFGKLRGEVWQGTGAIVGYCNRRNRILVAAHGLAAPSSP